MTRLLLLPGMNGTVDFFEDLLRALPPSIDAEAIAHSTSRPQGYAELVDELGPRVARSAPCALLGESFSGPLSILLAARHPESVRALVLVGTFVRSPIPAPPFVRARVGPALFRRRPPAWLVRAALFGDASPAQVARFQDCMASIDPAVLARRLQEVMRVDVREAFARLRIPIIYLAGRRDRLVRGWNVAAMQKLQPAMRVVSLDAPHLIAQRRPAESAAAIGEFLSGPFAPTTAASSVASLERSSSCTSL